jgi:hypothetical protein
MLSLPLVEGVPSLVAVTAIASSLLGYGTVSLTHLTDSLADDIQGSGLGLIRTGYMLIGAAGPTVVGVLADAGFFDESFFLLAAAGAAAVVASLLVHE